jgi:hypothetical protein
MTETRKQCECECKDCDCECHDFNPSDNDKLPLDKKIERAQYLSNGIVDLIEHEGLTNMEAIEALSHIITGLVSYEIRR